MDTEDRFIRGKTMFMAGHLFYYVRVQEQEPLHAKNGSKYGKHYYYLICRDYKTGKERQDLTLELCNAMSYNSMNMYITV